MLSIHLLNEAKKLLEEVKQNDTKIQHLDAWERLYISYKSLVKNAGNDLPTAVKTNLPYIGMGIQIAKKVDRPESCSFYLKNAKSKLLSDLRTIIAASKLMEQAV